MSNADSENEPNSGESIVPAGTPVPTDSASDEGPAVDGAQAAAPSEPASTDVSDDADDDAVEDAGAQTAAKGAAPTPGQRIAAQRAAKAARKAVEKARRNDEAAAKAAAEAEAEAAAELGQTTGPDEFEVRAVEMGRKMERATPIASRVIGLLAAAAVVLGAIAFVFSKRREDAGALLSAAVQAEQAEIGEAPENDDGRLRYATEAERTAEAMKRYRRVIRRYPSSDAAAQAHLAIARQFIDQGKFAEAQQELRTAREAIGTSEPEREVLVLELSVLARFGAGKYAEAQPDIDRIGRTRGGRYRVVADYLTARSLFERGQRDQAKTKLVALLAVFDGENAPDADHVSDQARALLRQIDPSAVPSQGGGLQGLEGLPPDVLRQIQEQLGSQGR